MKYEKDNINMLKTEIRQIYNLKRKKALKGYL